MAWMALLVFCTVTPEQNGWRPDFPTPGAPAAALPTGGNGQPPAGAAAQPSQGTPTPAGNHVAAPPTASGPAPSSYWTQLQDALAAPVSRSPTAGPSSSSGKPSQMRQAAGVQFPPAPPGAPNSAQFSPVSATASQNPAPRQEVLPPNQGQTADPRVRRSEILYEGDARGNFYQRPGSFRGKAYISPPPLDGSHGGAAQGSPPTSAARDGLNPQPMASRPNRRNPDLALPHIPPPGNAAHAEAFDRRHQAQRVNTSGQTSKNEASGSTADNPVSASDAPRAPKTAASDRWWPLLLTLLGLFGSLGFNFYLGWIAWDLHGRYQDVVADLHDLENQLDERAGEMDAERSGRRESRRMAALAG